MPPTPDRAQPHVDPGDQARLTGFGPCGPGSRSAIRGVFVHRAAGWLAVWWLLMAGTPVLGGGLQGHIQTLIQSSGLDQTKVGILVMDLDSGEELVELGSIEPMIPASNMKLITTATALHVLGPEFMFRTELRLIRPGDWQLPSGLVVAEPGFDPTQGPVLLVRGDGDPAFGDPTVLGQHDMGIDQLLDAWVQAVRDSGVRQVQRLVIDDRVFDRNSVHPSWPVDQLHLWYCAQVAGLNVHTNCLDVYARPTRAGESPRIDISPTVGFLSTSSRAVTGDSDTFWISRKPQTNELTYWGQVKHDRSTPYRVTLHDPPLFFAQLLAERLERAGVIVASLNTPGRDDLLPTGKTLHAVQTMLPVVLARCNKDSQNLFAEALLKRIGRHYTGSPGSWNNGAAAVRAFLRQTIGPRGASVIVADGSGLSRKNRVSARVLVDVLQTLHIDRSLGPLLRESLSVSGVDGTLRKRFSQRLTGRVHAKSGYIKGVSCLSGYLVVPGDPSVESVGADGQARRTIAFSFLFNDIKPPVYAHKIKKLQDDMLELIDQDVAREQQRIGG